MIEKKNQLFLKFGEGQNYENIKHNFKGENILAVFPLFTIF